MQFEEHDLPKFTMAKRKLFMVYAVLFSTLGIYVALVFLTPFSGDPDPSSARLLFYAVTAMGAFNGVAAVVLRHLVFRKLFDKPLGVDSSEAVSKAFERYITLCIPCFALAESAAILGLVLYFIIGSQLAFFILLGISAVSFALCRPSAEEMRDYAILQKTIASHSHL